MRTVFSSFPFVLSLFGPFWTGEGTYEVESHQGRVKVGEWNNAEKPKRRSKRLVGAGVVPIEAWPTEYYWACWHTSYEVVHKLVFVLLSPTEYVRNTTGP